MLEKYEVVKLANVVLEQHWRDPDGTECVLARQLLRRQEALVKVIEWFESLPDLFDEIPSAIDGARFYIPNPEK